MKTGKKRFIKSVSFIIFALFLISLYGFFSSPPQILSASIYPEKVTAGQAMLIRAEIKDSLIIKNAKASIETDDLPDITRLLLVDGSIRNGKYEKVWIAHDTSAQKWYNITITATNIFGKTASIIIPYQDPTQSHNASEIVGGTFTGNYSFMGGSIGIGSTTPVYKLEVDGDVNASGNIRWNATDMNPTNLLTNGDMELWSAGTSSAPDGWALYGAGAAIAREASIIKLGTYSAKMTAALNTDTYLRKDSLHTEKGITYWKGRTVTFGAWVYATAANRVRLMIDDNVGYGYSSYHTGDSTWQWLTATRVIDSSSTLINLYLAIPSGTITSVYIDGCMAVEGETAFAFSDKPLLRGGTVTAEVDETKFSHKIPVYIDGTLYYIMLTQS